MNSVSTNLVTSRSDGFFDGLSFDEERLAGFVVARLSAGVAMVMGARSFGRYLRDQRRIVVLHIVDAIAHGMCSEKRVRGGNEQAL